LSRNDDVTITSDGVIFRIFSIVFDEVDSIKLKNSAASCH